MPADPLCQECRRKEREEENKEKVEDNLKKVQEQQIGLWYEECGVQGLFIDKTFNDFKRDLQPKAYDAIKNYKGKSIVLLSPSLYGVGKTHLVCALVNQIIETEPSAYLRPSYGDYHITRCSCPVFFTTEAKLISRIRQTFNRKNNYDDESQEETEADIYDKLLNVSLLIIDDVGKVRPRDPSFLQTVIFRIIDDRYVHEQPIILTTNLGYEELEEHIGGASADRLREMCGKSGFIKMIGKSYRR